MTISTVIKPTVSAGLYTKATSFVFDMATVVDNTTRWIVARFGPYMHYAVPRILHANGRLERLYTDLYAEHPWIKKLGQLPDRLRPPALKRLLGRTSADLPADRVKSYPLFGLAYYVRRIRAKDWESSGSAHLWAGSEFGRRVVRDGFGDAGAVYTFNTAALEILQSAREHRLFTVLEQTIAPRAVEEDLLALEQTRFQDWVPPRHRDCATDAIIKREADEWSLADVILCGSEFVKEGIGRCKGPIERCVVVPYGVDSRFSPVVRSPHNGSLRVLTVGEAGLRKGVTYAFETAKILGARAELRWVGPISLYPEVKARVAVDVHLTSTVPRSEVFEHFAWADVFFLPSVCEGSATVTYEALSCGLPVITTPNAGSPVTDGVDGFIIPVGDVGAMVSRLQQLCEDRTLLQKMSSSAIGNRWNYSLSGYGVRLASALGLN